MILLSTVLACIALLAVGAYVYNNYSRQWASVRPIDPEVRLDMERIRANRQLHGMRSQIDRNVEWAKREAEREMRDY